MYYTKALNETETTIQSISKIHEMLYEHNNLEYIDSKEYFENLIKNLSKSFDTSNIKINFDLKTSLNLDKSIFIGIILNELFTNAFKYAFPENKGEINISLKNTGKNYILIFSDDGTGFDKEINKKSFGLTLINNIVKNELKGRVDIDSTNGTTYKIYWN